jgi:hypothetical protein
LRSAAFPSKGGFLRRPKDTFHEFLASMGAPCADLDLNGFYCVMALTWLQEIAEVDLMKSSHDDLATFLSDARQASCFILTQEHSDGLADSIEPESYSAGELTEYFKEFNELDDPESGKGMIDSMAWLKTCLRQVNAGHVGILMIG